MQLPDLPIYNNMSNWFAGPGQYHRKASRFRVVLLLSVSWIFLTAAVTGFAGGIIWGPPTTISWDTDVTNSGTALYAYAGRATTVNGVSFAAGSSGTTWGNVSFTSFGGYVSVFGSAASPFGTLSSVYSNVLSTAAWGNGTSGTVILNGLTSGHIYTVQIWVNDSRGGYQYRNEAVSSTGGNTVTLYFAPNSNSAGAVGQYVVGTFTASGTSQSFSINGNAVVQINAISVRDNSVGVFTPTPFTATRVNLAKYQPVITDSSAGTQGGQYITDGLTVNDSYWQSGPSGAHWAQVVFPFPVSVGSVQLVMGRDTVLPPTVFWMRYLTNGTWVNVAGTTVVGNTNKEVNLVFNTPVTASAFEFYDSIDGNVYIREMALYPPNGTNGFPFGTDFSIDLARKHPTFASANTFGNWPLLASDGRVSASSAWQTTLVGSNSLMINLQFTNKIGSVHLYSGATGIAPLTNFVLQYWDGGAWQNIPGGSVSGNTNGALIIPFTTPVTTTEVQLLFTNASVSAVQELGVFSANSNGGYPLGTGMTTNLPVTAKYDTYYNSYYYLSNTLAGQVVVESNGVPGLGACGPTNFALQNFAAQYQVLLNYDNGSYRLINRRTGWCLAGAQLTTNVGALLADEPYAALPDQDWFLQSIDGVNIFLVNQFSGLVVDILGGSTAAGTPLVQNVMTNSASQYWQISLARLFPKKGMGGGGTRPAAYRGSWYYDWGPDLPPNIPYPTNLVYFPTFEQPWYNQGNSISGNWWRYNTIWRKTANALQVQGYVEPDNASAYFDPTNSAIAWMTVQVLDVPLIGPGCANVNGTNWNPVFLNIVTNWGCRVEYLPGHEYGNPDGGSSTCWIQALQTAYNSFGIPMTMNEFSIVDWSPPGTNYWTEEDNYNSMAEFLWRAEQTSWLRNYSLFVFGASSPTNLPPNSWTSVTPGPTSYAQDSFGNFTAFGEAYAAWDDDANLETNKIYYLYNDGTRKRLQNTLGAAPGAITIRTNDYSVRWMLVSAGSPNVYYIVSALDGRLLSYTNGLVSLVAPGTTGTAAQWTMTFNQYSWFYLDHLASGLRLQLVYNNSTGVATFAMVSQSTTSTAVKWSFVETLPVTVWTGNGNNLWSNPTNWQGWLPAGIPPITAQPMTFNNLSTTNLNTLLNTSANIDSLIVTTPNGPVSVSGSGTNTLTVGNGGINLSAASQSLSINAPLQLAANQTWNVTNGQSLTVYSGVSDLGVASLNVAGGGTVSLGGANTCDGNTIVSGGTLNLTGSCTPSASGGTNIFIVNGGTLNFNLGSGSANFYGDGYSYSPQISDSASAATMTLQSGTLNVNTMPNAGTGNYAGLLLGCNSSTAYGTLVVNGGNLNVPGRILMAANGAGSQGKLTINGGTVTLGTPGSSGSYAVNGQGLVWFGGSTSTVNLYGGTLALWSLYAPTAGSSVTVNLSGGTLQAVYHNSMFTCVTAGTMTLKVSTNGVTIDPAGYAITIPNALTHDSGLSGADGGLTVNDSVGGGTLTLSTVNTFTGPTTVSAGTLALSGSGSVASQKIILAGGATFDVSGRSTPFALVSSMLTNSSVGAVINGTNNCSVGTLALVTDGTNAAFLQTNGTMTISASTVIRVDNPGAILTPGVHPLIAAATAGNPGWVSGPVPSVVVTGNGAAGVASLQIDGAGSLNLVVASPVAPNPASLSYSFGSNGLTLTWPGDHLGWIAQSNSLDLANTNYWFDILGSQFGTNLVLPIIPVTPQVYYRLRYP